MSSPATPPTDVSPARRALPRFLPLGVWALCMLNALLYLDRGWFAHDLGTIAHPAQRVLLGELPHRDFIDVYTGGLAFLNAGAYQLLGQTAMTARWMILAVYAAWVPVVWAIARRLLGSDGTWIAAAVTLLAAGWTLPMYAEGMPSWYNLFMATFALAAILRFVGDRRRRWLFVAGLVSGASILFKITGLYSVAAGLLGLGWLENADGHSGSGDGTAPGSDEPAGTKGGDLAYRLFMTGCAATLAALVTSLVVRAMGVAGLLRFGAAALAAPVVLAWMMQRPSGAASKDRMLALWVMALPYLAGVAAALLPFLAVYSAAGALDDLYQGLFVLPRERLTGASWLGHGGGWMGGCVALATVLAVAWAPRLYPSVGRVAARLGAVAGVMAVALSGSRTGYLVLWQGLWWLPPFVAAAAAVVVMRHSGPTRAVTPLFLALAAFGLASLVEVPFAAPIYFFYAAPLLLFPAAGAAALGGDARRRWFTGAVVVLLGFTALRLNPGFIRYLGFQPAHHGQTQVLDIPRGGGLHVDAASREEIEAVVQLVEALDPGPFIYATPDAPEIYFLTGKRNPTGDLYEFFDPHPETKAQRILDALDRTGVSVVVINRKPLFSDPVSPELVAGLQVRYPFSREAGRFLVVWMEPER